MSLANTSYQGEFIFSGTSTVQPFVAAPSSPSGVTYQGNTGTNSVAVGQGYSLQVNLPGSQLFTSPGTDMFQAMTDVINALQVNSGVGSAVTELNSAYSHITAQRVFFGNGMNQLHSQQNYLSSEKVNLSSAATAISGADTAQTATELAQAQLAVNAELAAMSRISQTSLFDYLK